MFQSPILDVTIGLVLLFLVLALVCISANEAIAQMLNLRAEYLWRAICSLFQNAKSGEAEKFARMIYDHNLVDALSPPGKNPSYIPSELFSLAVLDLLGMNGPDAAPKPIADLLDDKSKANDAVADPEAKLDPKIFETLKPLAVAAGSSLDAFRKNIESWFDSTMTRASGWYKRRIQTVTFFLALGLALIVNADAVTIGKNLWSNPTVRAQLAKDAVSVSKSNPPPATTLGRSTLPGTANIQKDTTPAAPITTPEMKAAEADVNGLIGWSDDPASINRFPRDFWSWVMKLAGLLITTLAACLGAPFWFGILGKVVSIRSSGPPPK